MSFAITFALLLLQRIAAVPLLPWRLLSVSTANFAGTVLFVALGLHYVPPPSFWFGIFTISVFYFFLLIGEYIGHNLPVGQRRIFIAGDRLLNNKTLRLSCLVLVVCWALLPMKDILHSQISMLDQISSTWGTYGISERSSRLLEGVAARESSGISALITGITRQLHGFWLIAVGIAFYRWPRTVLMAVLFDAFTQFVLGKGTRSGILISLSLASCLWLFWKGRGYNALRIKLGVREIVVLVAVGLIFFLGLDYMLEGRQGISATGSLVQRIERVLKTDFAYGGIGIQLTNNARSATLMTGIEYTFKLISLPVPRALWPQKSTLDPNLEMTEAFSGRPIEEVRSIQLFSPLGEALFYYGAAGLVIIPLLYGTLTSYLARVFLSSMALWGFLAYTYVWAFLGMRHTFWNVYGALIVQNVIPLFILTLLIIFGPVKRRVPYTRAFKPSINYKRGRQSFLNIAKHQTKL